jgi:hypothetical protein
MGCGLVALGHCHCMWQCFSQKKFLIFSVEIKHSGGFPGNVFAAEPYNG